MKIEVDLWIPKIELDSDSAFSPLSLIGRSTNTIGLNEKGAIPNPPLPLTSHFSIRTAAKLNIALLFRRHQSHSELPIHLLFTVQQSMMMTCLLNCYYFAFFLLSFLPSSGNGFTSSPTQHLVLMATSSSLSMHRSSDPVGTLEEEYNSADHKARRKVLVDAAVTATTLVTSAASSSPSLAADVTPSTQEDSNRSIKNGVVSTNKLASLLKSIPTFAIVDERGVPYFVVGEDAKLTSYFFLSYGVSRSKYYY